MVKLRGLRLAQPSAVLFLAGCHHTKGIVGRGALERKSILYRARQPGLAVCLGQQQHRHGLWVDGLHQGVGLGGQECKNLVPASDRSRIRTARALPTAPDASEEEGRHLCALILLPFVKGRNLVISSAN